jgi:hypothetical protein
MLKYFRGNILADNNGSKFWGKILVGIFFFWGGEFWQKSFGGKIFGGNFWREYIRWKFGGEYFCGNILARILRPVYF